MFLEVSKTEFNIILDKLEQLRNDPKIKGLSNNLTIQKKINKRDLFSEVEDLNKELFNVENEQFLTIDSLNKRAKSKYSQELIIKSLISLNNDYKEKYENTLNCGSVLLQTGNKITSRYCNNRWCKVCNRIRTAKLINGYAEQLDKLNNKYFVTLTLPNIGKNKLRETIKQMLKGIRDIQENWRKQKKYKIIGIRKLECTYNPDLDNYHPHFHFILQGEETAKELIKSWLNKFKNAVEWAQDYKICYDYKELFKYFTKMAAKSKINNEVNFYPEAIHNIFESIEKIRIFQPMGGIRLIKEDIDKKEAKEIKEIEEQNTIFIFEEDNYINKKTGEILTRYTPTNKEKMYREKIKYLSDNKKINNLDYIYSKILFNYEKNINLFDNGSWDIIFN